MFRPYHQDQMMLLPPSLKDFVGESHPAHMVNDIVEKLDLACFERRYGNMGPPAYHPRMILKIILYGFTVSIFSSRKLHRACEENLPFKYLAGMETPAFKTFIEFRKRHRDDMKAVFVETVKLARELRLAKLGAVALDGSKIGANTSKHKAMSYGRMQEEEKRLKEEMEKLLQTADETDTREDEEHGSDNDGYRLSDEMSRREERLRKIEEAKAALEEREKKEHPGKPIEDKKQISFADKEARCFTKKGDGTKYVHNSQAAVDMDSQIIVENHIEDSVSDAGAAEETLKNMEEDLGEKPGKLVADAGYGNSDTLKSCEDREITPVCSTSREGKDAKEKKEKGPGSVDSFTYDCDMDTLTCRHGHVFEFDHFRNDGKEAMYRSRDSTDCECGRYSLKDGRRVMIVGKGYLARQKLKRIMDEEGNRELYKRRKCTVEPVFGQIKEGMGFRRYLYRGRRNVRSEWNLVCAAFNIKKIAVLEAGKLAKGGCQGADFALLRLRETFLSGVAQYTHLFRFLVSLTSCRVAPLLHYV